MDLGTWGGNPSGGRGGRSQPKPLPPMQEYNSVGEREARSVALEKAYVHDVYSQIASHFTGDDSRCSAWPRVKQFLMELEPGSIVCDVGCGNGKYLGINHSTYKIGIDRCSTLVGAARDKNHEVLISDNLNIPFRDDTFDAVISIAVIHHFATTERRVAALQELARVLRIGGRLIVSVWALEQRNRRFESQDVLVPWNNRLLNSSSDDKTSSIERDLNSTTTTTTSDDDLAATHYHAYTQTSDSDHSFPVPVRPYASVPCRRRGRSSGYGHTHSIDPACPSSSQSSSDLSSPNESCYTFVRRALAKLAGTRRNRGGRRPWFLQGIDLPIAPEDRDRFFASLEEDAAAAMEHYGFPGAVANQPQNAQLMPIELRQLDSTNFAELLNQGTRSGVNLSSILYPRRRTLETPLSGGGLGLSGDSGQGPSLISAQPKSKSLSDLFGLLPSLLQRGMGQRKAEEQQVMMMTTAAKDSSLSSLSAGEERDYDEDGEAEDEEELSVKNKAVQTESWDSLADAAAGGGTTASDASVEDSTGDEDQRGSGEGNSDRLQRPTLVKQKATIVISPGAAISPNIEESNNGEQQQQTESPICWGEMKQSVKELPELRPSSGSNFLAPPPAPGGGFWKQSSLNEELIFSKARLEEKEALKQNIQKQASFNEELIYKRKGTGGGVSGGGDSFRPWDQMKEAFLNSPANVKCLQLLRNGISSRFNSSTTTPTTEPHNSSTAGASSANQVPQSSTSGASTSGGGGGSSPFSQQSQPPSNASSSIRNGIVRMLQNWKQGEDPSYANIGSNSSASTAAAAAAAARRGSSQQRRGLFPQFFLRRASVGSMSPGNGNSASAASVSPPPHIIRRPSEAELLGGGGGDGGSPTPNKLLPGSVSRHIRKLSREDGSDSSKDSSFQSDTSMDSEDSFASVIFIPNAANTPGAEFAFSNETRANSTDSDRSPKSPRLSPPNYIPKSPSPLASEVVRRQGSPEVSPFQVPQVPLQPPQPEVTKFLFDESATAALTITEEPEEQTEQEWPSTSAACKATTTTTSTTTSTTASTTTSSTTTTRIEKKVIEKVELVVPPFKSGARKKNADADKIQVLRKPGPGVIYTEGNKISRQIVRRSIPKSLAVELYNPETDDAGTSSSSSSSSASSSPTSSSSKASVSSVVSVNDNSSSNQSQGNQSQGGQSQQSVGTSAEKPTPPPTLERKSSSASILETAASVVSSLESFVSGQQAKQSQNQAFGSTSEWLSSLPPADLITHDNTALVNHPPPPPQGKSLPSFRCSSLERKLGKSSSTGGEKLLLGDVKKYYGPTKGADAKWPSSILDSPHHHFSLPETFSSSNVDTLITPATNPTSTLSQITAPLPQTSSSASIPSGESEEADSLFDSLENLSTTRQHPSRNPSIESSVRMSSTTNSLKGGESFESWSSAKSSLTNSSSQPHPPSTSAAVAGCSKGSTSNTGGGSKNGKVRIVDGDEGGSSSGQGSGDGALTLHRYYHVFREGELDKLIEKYVQNLHVISSYYDHANWCIVAEKVQVWTI